MANLRRTTYTILLACAAAVRVGIKLDVRGEQRLVRLHEFGSNGGSVDTTLSLEPTQCTWGMLLAAGYSSCWAATNQLYLVVTSSTQWHNMSETIKSPEPAGTIDCLQPSASRAALSYTRWYETAQRAGVAPADPSGRRSIDFNVRAALPGRPDLYTLALFNCGGGSLSVSGEAHFLGEGGEPLSLPAQTVYKLRIAMCAVCACAALALAAACAVNAPVAVPLQRLLAVVLLLRAATHLFRLLPLSPGVADTYVHEPEGSAPSWAFPVGLYLLAQATELLAAIGFVCALVGLSAGRHFLEPVPAREREMFFGAVALYFLFGMLQLTCSGDVSCGIFVLAFQVVRILLIFGVILFINASAETLRRAHGHAWETLQPELVRLSALRSLRLRLLVVYLVLPIFFMFLQVQVLDWRSAWFRTLWREVLDLYLVLLVAWRVGPSARTYAAHFQWLRPPPNAPLNTGLYATTFRWLLGCSMDGARADAAVAAARAREHED